MTAVQAVDNQRALPPAAQAELATLDLVRDIIEAATASLRHQTMRMPILAPDQDPNRE